VFRAFLPAGCVAKLLIPPTNGWPEISLPNFSFAARMIAAAIDVGSFFHRLTGFTAIFFRGAAGTDGMRALFCFGSH
jgi:hypothetical protein